MLLCVCYRYFTAISEEKLNLKDFNDSFFFSVFII